MFGTFMEDSLRRVLVEKHGEKIVACYEQLFPGELKRFNDRYCGEIEDFDSWASGCYESAYSGYDEDNEGVPSLEDFVSNEFFHYYSYDEELCVGFVNL
jgi:hypothetical protein